MFKDPAFGNEFFDREKVSSILAKRVEAFREGYHQNIGLIGKPSIGKSSILQNFVLTMSYPDIIPIYVEVGNESFEGFAHRYMGMILTGYFQSEGKNLPHEIEYMLKAARRALPLTTKNMAKVLQLLKKHKYEEVFFKLFTLITTLAEETDKKIVLVIDEFSLFEEFGLKDPFSAFGKQIMIQKNTMFVVSSSLIKGAYEIFNEKLALLFGNFEVIKVKPFDFRTAQNFVRTRLQPFTITNPLLRFIVWITDGHPYYLSIINRKVKTLVATSQSASVTKSILLQALEEEMFYLDGQLSRYFSLYFASLFSIKQSSYMNVLVSLALGRRKVKEIAQFTEKRQPEVKKILAKLVAEEIVEKNSQFYNIHDPLLCLWLKYTYNVRRVSLRINKAILNAEFKRYTSHTLSMYLSADRMTVCQRFEELLNDFRDDVVVMGKTRQKLLHFSSVVSEQKRGYCEIVAKQLPQSWKAYVWNKKVSEDDIATVIDARKKTRAKAKKTICVIPYGIDINAKLVAQEARIVLWRLKDINYLLDLYDRPKCIIESDEPTYHEESSVEECHDLPHIINPQQVLEVQ